VTPPFLGLLVSPGYPDGVPRLLERMVRWCRPVWADPERDDPAAWLATAPTAAGLSAALASGAPVAVWVASASDLALAAGEVLTVGDDVALDVDVLAPPSGIDASAVPPMPPFVRARWRARHGLPERFIVRAGTVGDGHRQSAYALASVVIVEADPAALVEAMAWGAPCVTDSATAAAVGADIGVDVLVGDAGDLGDLAAVLADDQRRAAAFGRSARRLVERTFDRTGAARRLAGRLGLVEWGEDDWRGRLTDDLAHLCTPPVARIRDRFDSAVAGVVGETA
jgi:hypothetical protein